MHHRSRGRAVSSPGRDFGRSGVQIPPPPGTHRSMGTSAPACARLFHGVDRLERSPANPAPCPRGRNPNRVRPKSGEKKQKITKKIQKKGVAVTVAGVAVRLPAGFLFAFRCFAKKVFALRKNHGLWVDRATALRSVFFFSKSFRNLRLTQQNKKTFKSVL